MQTIFDVAVVGGGPSGAMAALTLAAAGVTVVLLEKQDLPRYKTCGGGVAYRARSILPVDMSSAVEREFYGATMSLLSSNVSFGASRSKPLITMTMRASLDHLLVLSAEAAGAAIRPRTEVHSLSFPKGAVDLGTNNGPITAKFVIAADGVNSRVAKLAGWKETRTLIPAIETELYLPDKELKAYLDQARFDFDIPPHGYAWVFPKADHLSVGVLNVARGNVALKTAFAQYCHVLGIKRIAKEERHGFVIPISPRRDGFARNRVMLVGDSAGFAEPVTGEGISFAIRSGQLAAEALLQAEFEVSRASEGYERRVRETIAPELSAARILARFLYGLPNFRTWAFRHYGSKFTNAVADIFMGQRTYYGAISNPHNYLKLISL